MKSLRCHFHRHNHLTPEGRPVATCRRCGATLSDAKPVVKFEGISERHRIHNPRLVPTKPFPFRKRA